MNVSKIRNSWPSERPYPVAGDALVTVRVHERLAIRGIGVGEEAHEGLGGEEALGELGTVVGHQRVDEVVAANNPSQFRGCGWRRKSTGGGLTQRE